MTTWDDLTENSELPLDALARRAAEPAPDRSPEPEPVSEDGGLGDPSGSVTVWVDDEFAVTRIRVSERWRERGDEPLARRILFAAQQATLGRLYADQAPAEDAGPGEPRYAGGLLDEPFDEREVADVLERTLQLRDELRALDARDDVRPTVVRHQETVGRTLGSRASVTLDHHRRPSALELDARWLSGARTGQIADAVQSAFADAYARWQEPEIEHGEYAELADRLDDLQRRTARPLLIACGWTDPGKDES